MERTRHRRDDDRDDFLAPSPRGVEGLPEPEPRTVQIIWGPLIENLALAGMTVAEARTLLRAPFNLAPHAATLVNGSPVGADHRLVAGESLEFRREFGEKGGTAT